MNSLSLHKILIASFGLLVFISPQYVSDLRHRTGILVSSSPQGISAWFVLDHRCIRLRGPKFLPKSLIKDCFDVHFNHENKYPWEKIMPQYLINGDQKRKRGHKSNEKRVLLCQRCQNPLALKIPKGKEIFFALDRSLAKQRLMKND